MGVVAGQAVVATALVAQADAGTSRGIDVDQVKCRAKVDEERIVALTREHLTATANLVDRRRDECRVVGGRLGTDIVGRRQEVAPNRSDRLDLAVRPERHLGDVIPLNDVQVVVRPCRRVVHDLAAVVQEAAGLPGVRVKPESIGDVLVAVTRVVDLDLVSDVVRKPEEVGASGRLLKRDEVGDERRGVRLVGADERVDVGVVCCRVLTDPWCFAVAGAPCERWENGHGPNDGKQRRYGERLASGDAHVSVLSWCVEHSGHCSISCVSSNEPGAWITDYP